MILDFTSQNVRGLADALAGNCRGTTIAGLLSLDQREVADRWAEWTKDLVCHAWCRSFLVFVASYIGWKNYDDRTTKAVRFLASHH